MDAIKNRARAFTEGIMIMICPVLLAIEFDKVTLKAEGNRFVGGSICPIAAVTLEAGLFPFLGLCVSKNLVELSPRISRCLFGVSKFQMALAFGNLLVINMKNLLYLLFLIPFMALTLWRCYWSVQNGPVIDETLYRGCECVLERSLDFSAAVTAILFLGLEGLALEGHSNEAKGLGRLLGVSFTTCVVGVFIMLLGTVPPLIADSRESSKMCCIVEMMNVVLAIAIGMTVLLIASAALKELTWLVLVPPLVSFMVWLFVILDDDDEEQPGQEQVKPASMELTKVTFTGFLAVSVPSFGNNSLSNYSHAFIVLTAAAVITGLGWRLLTHTAASSRAMEKAANVASFCAHLCVAAAVIPFTTMAVNALK